MTHIPTAPAATDALIALGRALVAAGYRFTTVTPATHGRVNTRDQAKPASSLRDIFGWSRPFAADALSPDLLALMRQAGVLAETGNTLRATVRASTLGDGLYFHSAYPTDADDAVFFGPDTYRFMAAVKRAMPTLATPPQRVADIGSGAGAAAIGIALRYPQAEVLALDINEAALVLARVNARLAGAANVAVHRSDLLGGVDGEFDLIVANPPYLPDAEKRTYRDGGGKRGAELSLAIVKAALARLRPGGCLFLYTGVVMTGPDDAFLAGIAPLLEPACSSWHYEELDPDVFGEELSLPGYENVERICVVWLRAVKSAHSAVRSENSSGNSTTSSILRR